MLAGVARAAARYANQLNLVVALLGAAFTSCVECLSRCEGGAEPTAISDVTTHLDLAELNSPVFGS